MNTQPIISRPAALPARRMLVLGNGPSLKPAHFSLMEGVDTLGMNAAYRYWRRIGWYPTYYACLDDQVVVSHADEIWKLICEGRCRRFFLHPRILESHPALTERSEVTFLPQRLYAEKHRKACAELGLEHAPDIFFRTNFGSKLTTGSYAVRFAASLGYREIGLIGIDCRYTEVIDEAEPVEDNILKIARAPKKNPNYFFDDYQQEGDIYNLPNPAAHGGNLHLQSFEAVKADFSKYAPGTVIKICTTESELYDQKTFAYEPLDRFVRSARLSAVFTPFVKTEVAKLISRFQTWGADGFTPYASPPAEPSVGLHLAFNATRDREIEEELSRAFAAAGLSRFFSGVTFHYSELEGLRDLYTRSTDGPHGPEGYMAGPNNQFFDIIQKFSAGMSHIALIESDVAPIKSGWLEKIEAIVEQSERFWICGSHYRGLGEIQALWHVNGNAIYNVGDPAFQQFFETQFLPHFRERVMKSPRTAYDIVLHDMFRSVFGGPRTGNIRRLWSECAHRIRFSDFIVDISHDEDRKPENLLDLKRVREKFPDSALAHGAVSLIDQDILTSAKPSVGTPRAAPERVKADIVIIDPDAVDWFGHYMAYNDNLSAALEARGYNVKVICNTGLLPEIRDARPAFMPRLSVASRLVGKEFNNARAAAVFEQELSSALDEFDGPPPLLYMYCGSFSHAEAIARLIENRPGLQAHVNLFYEAFSECDTPEWHARWIASARRISRVSNRMAITVPTEKLKSLIETKTGIEFSTAPHPSTAINDSAFDSAPGPRHFDGRIPFVALFPGSTRRGKGYGLSVEAARHVAASGVNVVLRCPIPEEAALFRESLDSLPKSIQIIEGSLVNEVYLDLFRHAHVSVLLYDPQAFAKRTSGLLIDSIYHGLPVITLKGNWLAEIVERFGCGVTLDSDAPDAIAAAVDTIRVNYANYRERAEAAAKVYFEKNSWSRLAMFIAGDTERDAMNAGRSGKRRLLIIGNGPSTRRLVEAGLDKIPDDVDTFGMGAAYRFFSRVGWWPTFYALADSKVVHSHREALTALIEDPAISTERFYFPLPLSNNPKLHIIPHSSTGDFCFRKSIELGYDEIYLIGIEGSYVEEIAECRPLTDEEFVARGFETLNLPPEWRKLLIITKTPESNPNYFFDDYQRAGDIYSLPQSNSHRNSWAQSASHERAKSRRIFNLSNQSAITEFPFLSLDEFLASSPLQTQSEYPTYEPHAFGRAACAQVNETAAVAHLLSLRLGKRHTMLAVGAKDGYAAKPFHEMGWSVHCFEPDPAHRTKLVQLYGTAKTVSIDSRALGEKPAEGVAFHIRANALNKGDADSFSANRAQSARVDITTIEAIAEEKQLKCIDFLRIAAAEHGLVILKGAPWDRLKPDVIECEFEDAKTLALGHSWRDIAEFLRGMGYAVYVSEWHPVVQYGIAHDWRRVAAYPGADVAPGGWGNLLAFREDPGLGAVRAALASGLTFRDPSRRAASKPAIQNAAPAAPTEESSPAPPRPFYAPFGEWLMKRSPNLFGALRAVRRAIAGLWRRRRWTLPALLILALIPLLGFLPAFADARIYLWGGAAFLLAMAAIAYLGLRVYYFVGELSASIAMLQTEAARERESFSAALAAQRSEINDTLKKEIARAHEELSRLRADLHMERQRVGRAIQAAKAGDDALMQAAELFRTKTEAALMEAHVRIREAMNFATQADAALKSELEKRHASLAEAVKKDIDRTSGLIAEAKSAAAKADRAAELFRTKTEAALMEAHVRIREAMDFATQADAALKSELEKRHASLAKAVKKDIDRTSGLIAEAKSSVAKADRAIGGQQKELALLRERVGSGERQIGRIRYPDAPSTLVFFGHHKCASRFFRREVFGVAAEATGARVRRYHIQNPPFHYSMSDELDLSNIDFGNLGEKGRDVVLFSNATKRSLTRIRRAAKDWKGLRILRDPRQVLVSNYLHHKEGHPFSSPDGWVWDLLAHDQPILRELPEEEGLLFELNSISKQIIETQLLCPFDDERIMTVKIEDFAADPKGHLLRISQFLNVADIAGIDFDNTYSNPQGGHWRSHFTSRLREVFKERYGQALIDMGYAEDMDW